MLSVGQFLSHLRLPTWGGIPSPSLNELPGRGMGFLGFHRLILQRHCTLWLLELSSGSHTSDPQKVLSPHPSPWLWSLLPPETTKQLEILISQPKSLSTDDQMSPEVTAARPRWKVPTRVAAAFTICQLTRRESPETQQEGGFLRHVKNIFMFVYI